MRHLHARVPTGCAVVAFALGGGSAAAQIIGGPDATKVCAGSQGGGIKWSLMLNEGWPPSAFIQYRVILRDPTGRMIGYPESLRLGGGWIGPYRYWDRGEVTTRAVEVTTGLVVFTNSLSEPTVGTCTFTLQLRVDSRYPDIHAVGRADFDSPKHADQWVTQTTKIQVYRCA
jgi:hypothetical protein